MSVRVVVLRLVGGEDEGRWFAVSGVPRAVRAPGIPIDFVPTGCVEWRDDDAAEVWVPAEMLHVWQAEHMVDAA